MNALTHLEAPMVPDQGKKHFRKLNPDTVPEGASFNEPMQPPSALRPHVPDGRTFETFIGGAGI